MKLTPEEKKKLKLFEALSALVSKNPNLSPEEFFLAMDKAKGITETPKGFTADEIIQIEVDLMKRAREIARNLGVGDYPFHVFFNPIHGQDWRIKAGEVVEIYTSVMPTNPRFETRLREILRKLHLYGGKRNGLVKLDYLIKIDHETKLKTKEMFKDIGEVLPMLPLHRLRTSIRHQVTVQDKVTKKKISIWSDEGELEWDTMQRARFLLSRELILNDKEDYWSYEEHKESDLEQDDYEGNDLPNREAEQ
jgi:hypothetical protein